MRMVTRMLGKPDFSRLPEETREAIMNARSAGNNAPIINSSKMPFLSKTLIGKPDFSQVPENQRRDILNNAPLIGNTAPIISSSRMPFLSRTLISKPDFSQLPDETRKAIMKNRKTYQDAERLRRKGEGDDTVLAHIHPAEANFLAQHFGGDINHETGLPQFGFKLKHIFKPVEKVLRKPMKTILPIAGSVAGSMFGGPLGGILGGALGGGASSRHHRLDHMLGGALTGGLLGSFLPMAGQGLGLDPTSGIGKMMGMGHPGLFEQMGIGGGGGILGGAGKIAGAGTAAKYAAPLLGPKPKQGYGAGDLQDLPSENNFDWGSLKSWIDPALMGVGVIGSLASRQKHQHQPSVQEQYNEMIGSRHREAEAKYKAIKPKKRRQVNPEEQHQRGLGYSYFEQEPEEEHHYADGGHVVAQYAPLHVGYVKGVSSGVKDDVPAHIPEGSYVMDATTVSLLGDGNSDHGAEKIRELEEKFMRGGFVRNWPRSENIRAQISTGEYVMSPEAVIALGEGDGKKGAKTLDKMRKNLRSQKGVKTFLPPKAKAIEQYMR